MRFSPLELILLLLLGLMLASVRSRLKKSAQGVSERRASTKPHAQLPISEQWTRVALNVVFYALCVCVAADLLSIGWFLFHQNGERLGPWGYIEASGYLYLHEPTLDYIFVFGLFPPLVFLLLLCLGGIVVSISQALRLNSLPEQNNATRYWFFTGIGLTVLSLIFIFQPSDLQVFGVWLIVLESLLFSLVLLAVSRLARWLLLRRPEDALFVTKPLALFIAGYLSLVLLAWATGWLNLFGPVGAALYVYSGDSDKIIRGTARIVLTVLVAPWLVHHIAFYIYLAILAHYRSKYELSGVAQSPTNVIGAIKMKVFNNGEFVEEGEQSQDQSLARVDPPPLSTLAKYSDPRPSSFGVLDRLRSKVDSTIHKRILEDQTKVTDAQAKAMEAQKKVMDQKVSLMETATKGQRARNEYELLPEERRVMEMTYQVSQSELELQKLKLEAEKKKLEQMMNGTYAPEPEGVAEIKEARQKDKHYNRQSYMAEAEEDSITARCQALDDWYDEKQSEIMGNQRLDVTRQRQQLDVLDKEYKLRRKQLDDQISAKLEEMEGGAINV